MVKNQFEKGQVVDILDINDVYCPAIIQSISADKSKLFVTYIGWSEDWDETIDINSERINVDKKTIMVKAWVKIDSKLTLWPCKIFVRYTLKDSEKGEAYLRSERRVFLLPYGPEFHKLKPYTHGIWMTTANIISYDTKTYSQRIADGETSKNSIYFKEAVRQCESDENSVVYKFRFDGSLDIEEKNRELRRLLLQKKLKEKEEKLLQQQQYKAMYSTGGKYGSRSRSSGDDTSLPGQPKKQKSSSQNVKEESQSLPQWSKYFVPFNMFHTSLQNVHPAGFESVQNVIRVLEAQKELQTESRSLCKGNVDNSTFHSSNHHILSKLESSDLSELFPFKIASLCTSMHVPECSSSSVSVSRLNSDKSVLKSTTQVSVPTKKTKEKSGKKPCRTTPRKSSNPKHIEIKRQTSYLTANRIKQSFSSSSHSLLSRNR